MADTILIICPECEKAIKAPEDVVGKKIRCKGCGETFTAKPPKAAKAAKPAKPAEKPAKAAEKPKDGEDAEGAYGITHEYLGARCPECAEPMGDDDKICLACGYSTLTRSKPKRRKVRETTGGDVFWWLLPGILNVILVLVTMTLVILYVVLVRAENFEEESWWRLLAWKALKVWAAIMGLGISFFAGRFAVKRLILNNTPPEIEEKWGEKE